MNYTTYYFDNYYVDNDLSLTLFKNLFKKQEISEQDARTAFFKPYDKSLKRTLKARHLNMTDERLGVVRVNFYDNYNIAIKHKEADVNQICGDYYLGHYKDEKIISYSLNNVKQSLEDFRSKVELPDFFFWKAILKPKKYNHSHEKFGNVVISNEESSIVKDNVKYTLRDVFYPEQQEQEQEQQEDPVLIEHDNSKELEALRKQIESLAQSISILTDKLQ